MLEVGSLRSGCQHGQVLVRAPFWIADTWLLFVPSYGRKQADMLPLWPLLIRALIPFMEAPPSWLNYLPRPPPPNTIPLRGLDINVWICAGDTNIPLITSAQPCKVGKSCKFLFPYFKKLRSKDVWIHPRSHNKWWKDRIWTSPMTSNSGFFPLLGLPISVSMFLPFIPLCPRGRVHFWNLVMLEKLLQNSPGPWTIIFMQPF